MLKANKFYDVGDVLCYRSSTEFGRIVTEIGKDKVCSVQMDESYEAFFSVSYLTRRYGYMALLC